MPRLDDVPCMAIVDCSKLQPPPPAMCNRFTGVNPKIEQSFFSIPENDRLFEKVYRALKSEIRHWTFAEGAELVLPVACMAGCHRSVAMAERLARAISERRRASFRIRIEVQHLNLAIHVLKRKRQSQANYDRYRYLEKRVIIGDDYRVRRL